MELIDREQLKAAIRKMVELPNEARAQVIGAINRAKAVDFCPTCGRELGVLNITENTRTALEKMGENVHSEIDFDYAAED